MDPLTKRSPGHTESYPHIFYNSYNLWSLFIHSIYLNWKAERLLNLRNECCIPQSCHGRDILNHPLDSLLNMIIHHHLLAMAIFKHVRIWLCVFFVFFTGWITKWKWVKQRRYVLVGYSVSVVYQLSLTEATIYPFTFCCLSTFIRRLRDPFSVAHPEVFPFFFPCQGFLSSIWGQKIMWWDKSVKRGSTNKLALPSNDTVIVSVLCYNDMGCQVFIVPSWHESFKITYVQLLSPDTNSDC